MGFLDKLRSRHHREETEESEPGGHRKPAVPAPQDDEHRAGSKEKTSQGASGTDIAPQQAALVANADASPSSGPDSVHLEPFFASSNTSKLGSALCTAQQDLHKAMEGLETVLRQKQPSNEYGDMLRESMKAHDESLPSFTSLAESLQSAHDLSQASIKGQVGRFMAAMYPVSKLVLGLTGTAASNAGFAPLQITANGLGQILDFLIVPHRQTSEILSGLDSLIQDQDLLDRLRRFPGSAIDERITVNAVKLQTAFTKFLQVSVVWLRQRYGFKLLVAAVGLQDVPGSKSTLEGARIALRTSLSDDLYLTVKWNDLKNRNHARLEEIHPYGDHTLHLIKQKDLHKKRLQGTGESVITDKAYHQWRSGDTATLWCEGLAGAGKTYAASAVIDDLESHPPSPDHGLAFYYFDFSRRDQQNAEKVIAALTRQLISRNMTLCNNEELPFHGPLPDLDERRKLFTAVVKSFKAVHIVLDAMDEFSSNHEDRIELTELLAELRDEFEPSRLRICILSRQANDVCEKLSSATKVTVRASEEEIRKYVHIEFPRNSHAKKMIRQDSSLLGLVETTLIDKSSRIFKLASLQIEHVLQAASPMGVRDILKNHLRSDIPSYYKITIERIMEKPEYERKLIFRLLTWIFYCRRPIGIAQLSIALQIEDGIKMHLEEPHVWAIADIDYYISACEGLLTTRVEPMNPLQIKNRTVADVIICQFAHETVQTYFQDNINALDTDGNCIILSTCTNFQIEASIEGLKFVYNLGEAMEDGMYYMKLEAEKREEEGKGDDRTEGQKEAEKALWLFWAWSMSWGDYTEPALEENAEVAGGLIDNFTSAIEAVIGTDREPSHWWHMKPLHYCALNGWSSLCQYLLSKGTDPNILSKGYWNFYPTDPQVPMIALWLVLTVRSHICQKEPALNTVMVLLADPRTDPNIKMKEGMTPLTWIIENDYLDSSYYRDFRLEVLHSLLDRKDIDINEPDDLTGNPLVWAAEKGRFEYIRPLLNHPAIDLNYQTGTGLTPLMLAVRASGFRLLHKNYAGYKEMVKLLASHNKTNVNTQDKDGSTALHIASYGGQDLFDKDTLHQCLKTLPRTGRSHTFCIQTLLSHKDIRVNIEDKAGHTPLDYALAGQVYARKLLAGLKENSLKCTDLELENKDNQVGDQADQLLGSSLAVLSVDEMERMDAAAFREAICYMLSIYEEIVRLLKGAGAESRISFEVKWEEDDSFSKIAKR